jgi:hypothetical protein
VCGEASPLQLSTGVLKQSKNHTEMRQGWRYVRLMCTSSTPTQANDKYHFRAGELVQHDRKTDTEGLLQQLGYTREETSLGC